MGALIRFNVNRRSDLIENPASRAPVMMVLDTSASMAGSRSTQLAEGLNQFIRELGHDDYSARPVGIPRY